MMDISRETLIENIKALSEKSVLVVGDLALDEMIYGDTERISREAPVLILRHSYTKYILGGASNAANNAASINGGKVSVIGVVGDDYHASDIKNAFEIAGINCKYLVEAKGRRTITKTRISGSCSHSITQQIVRIDTQSDEPLPEKVEKQIIKNLEAAIPEHDALILSDYHIGTLTQKVINAAIKIANKYKKIIVVDAQKDLDNYKNITSMTPNLPDTQKYIGRKIETREDFVTAGKYLISDSKAKFVLITCGGDGMMLVTPKENYHIPVFNKSKVFDVTGAGDTVTAVYTLALAAGAEPVYAAVIGNIAAGIVVKEFGCATTSINAILKNIPAKINIE